MTGRGVFAQSTSPQQRSQQLLKRLNVRGGEADSSLIAPLLAGAFADRIARRRGQDGRYQLANGMGAMLDADDALSRHEWLIAPLLLQGSASPDARILLALLVDIDELVQRCPQLVQQSDTVEWDDAQGTLKAASAANRSVDGESAAAGETVRRRVASGDA